MSSPTFPTVQSNLPFIAAFFILGLTVVLCLIYLRLIKLQERIQRPGQDYYHQVRDTEPWKEHDYVYSPTGPSMRHMGRKQNDSIPESTGPAGLFGAQEENDSIPQQSSPSTLVNAQKENGSIPQPKSSSILFERWDGDDSARYLKFHDTLRAIAKRNNSNRQDYSYALPASTMPCHYDVAPLQPGRPVSRPLLGEEGRKTFINAMIETHVPHNALHPFPCVESCVCEQRIRAEQQGTAIEE